MASYPTSVFNPAIRSNGQTIDAAHVNDLQGEVTAVENALLGTITHSLNVSGASTLATLQAAASTFSVRPVTPPPDAAKLFLQSAQELGSSADSTILWTSQDYLINSSLHSTASNPERLTPQSTGVYFFSAQASISANSTGVRQIQLRDSSAAFAAASYSSQSAAFTAIVSGSKRFDVIGGFVTVAMSVTGASTLSLAAGIAQTQITMVKL